MATVYSLNQLDEEAVTFLDSMIERLRDKRVMEIMGLTTDDVDYFQHISQQIYETFERTTEPSAMPRVALCVVYGLDIPWEFVVNVPNDDILVYPDDDQLAEVIGGDE